MLDTAETFEVAKVRLHAALHTKALAEASRLIPIAAKRYQESKKEAEKATAAGKVVDRRVGACVVRQDKSTVCPARTRSVYASFLCTASLQRLHSSPPLSNGCTRARLSPTAALERAGAVGPGTL
eukprot:SAG22_NODE_317_length_12513_cov_41.467214_7_plen_125_part_00